MQKLTDNQKAAIKLIQENPGKVVAWLRGEKGFLTINGNVERKLHTLGIIAPRKVEDRDGYEVNVWEVVRNTDPYETAREAARAEGRRMGLTEEQIDRFMERLG